MRGKKIVEATPASVVAYRRLKSEAHRIVKEQQEPWVEWAVVLESGKQRRRVFEAWWRNRRLPGGTGWSTVELSPTDRRTIGLM